MVRLTEELGRDFVTNFDAAVDMSWMPEALQPAAALLQDAFAGVTTGRYMPAWPEWRKPHRRDLIAIGAATATSAAVVGYMAYPSTRRMPAAVGSSAMTTMFVARSLRMPVRRAGLPAGVAAASTAVLCSMFREE